MGKVQKISFEDLVLELDPNDRDLFHKLRVVRVCSAHVGDTLFVTRAGANSDIRVVDEMKILDFRCEDGVGPSIELSSKLKRGTEIVGVSPVNVFGHQIFLWLPLTLRISSFNRTRLEFNLAMKAMGQSARSRPDFPFVGTEEEVIETIRRQTEGAN